MSYYAVPKERLLELLNLPKKRVLASVINLLRTCEELVEEKDGSSTDSTVSDGPGANAEGEAVELLSETGSISQNCDLASMDRECGSEKSQE
ncbi:MAG: hypothetical protein [Cressdnaviricota sp.]|nr:MAG: hypothetical protein [Cressdnaviricota sp.]